MPQPIDIQTELARSTAAQRVQEIADRASLAAQQRQTQHALQQQVDAETVIQQAPQSEHDAAVNDRHDDQGQQRRRARKDGKDSEQSGAADHGAGGIEVIPDHEQHRLDIDA
jgi:hypothetical protein